MSAPTRAVLDARLTRVEEHLGLAAPVIIRPPPRRPFYTHLPYHASGPLDWARMTRERIEAGWATGAYLYYGPGDPLAWGPEWDAFAEEFPDGCDLMVSPKALDANKLDDFLSQLPDVFWDRFVYAYWQEPEDNHLTPAKRADFRAKVTEAADVVRAYGVPNAVNMQTYCIGPARAHGGPQAIVDMVPADAVDFFGWSVFDFNGNDSGPMHVGNAAAFMAEHYPGTAWGITSLGMSVPQGTPAGDPARVERAGNVANALAAMTEHGSSASSWYDVPVGNENRDFGVDPELLPVLVAASA